MILWFYYRDDCAIDVTLRRTRLYRHTEASMFVVTIWIFAIWAVSDFGPYVLIKSSDRDQIIVIFK
jgi:hypothetical protein